MDYSKYTGPIINCLAIIFSFFTLMGVLATGALISLGLWKLIELLQ